MRFMKSENVARNFTWSLVQHPRRHALRRIWLQLAGTSSLLVLRVRDPLRQAHAISWGIVVLLPHLWHRQFSLLLSRERILLWPSFWKVRWLMSMAPSSFASLNHLILKKIVVNKPQLLLSISTYRLSFGAIPQKQQSTQDNQDFLPAPMCFPRRRSLSTSRNIQSFHKNENKTIFNFTTVNFNDFFLPCHFAYVSARVFRQWILLRLR